MPLTPTDVANKQFRIAFRGYSLDEVDAFLDEVETELSRLLRDNAGLKDGAGPSSALAAPAAAPEPAPRPAQGLEGQEQALRTLLLAQRTADEAIAEARAEAEQMVTAARTEAEAALGSARSEATSTLNSSRSEAERTLGSARAEAGSTLGKARSEAESTLVKARSEAESALSGARAEAESTLRAAQAKAARVDEDVASRIQAATGGLEEQRRVLEVRIEELRAFEREYRTRLKAYLEIQLRDLDSKQGADDGGAGVPARARTAAVGLTPGGAAGVRPRAFGTAQPAAAPDAATPAGPPAAGAPAAGNSGAGSSGAGAPGAGTSGAGATSVALPDAGGPGAGTSGAGTSGAGASGAGTSGAGSSAEGRPDAGPSDSGSPGTGRSVGAAPADEDGETPSGPPREAKATGPRAVPPLTISRSQVVGPFVPRPVTEPRDGV